nr:hypothetical protein CTI12_AA533660 [Tanacetum cinerariifolium]
MVDVGRHVLCENQRQINEAYKKLQDGWLSSQDKFHILSLKQDVVIKFFTRSALHTTPEPTPLLDTPTSIAPSPYIVNNKRRGPRLSKAFSEDDATLRQAIPDEKTTEIVKSLEAEDVESFRVVNGIVKVSEVVEGNDANDVASGEDKNENLERDSRMYDFFDPQDCLSVTSSTYGENSFRLDRSLNLNTSASEFYDAWEGKLVYIRYME